ncbi:MAG: hypothetical protein ACRDRE_08410, partial [Pseudonocardiaceae bacterium]
PGDLLPISLGHHPALTAHSVLLIDGVADDLHQDQLLRPVGIKPAHHTPPDTTCLAMRHHRLIGDQVLHACPGIHDPDRPMLG